MSTRTYPRRRRKRACPPLLRGLAVSVLATVALVIVFALLIAIFGMSDGVVRVVNQLIKLLAVLLGVRVAVPTGDPRGAMQGALLGVAYMGVGVMLYALLSGQRLTALDYVIDLMTGVAAGGLYGIYRASREAK